MQITQCPECHTAFKVSSEHLAVANGWVRCGRCGGVFEALRHLESDDAQVAVVEATDHTTTHSPTHAEVPTTSNIATPSHAKREAVSESTTQAAASDIDAFHDSLLS